MYYGAHTLWLLGYPDHARARADEGHALIERLAHPHTRAVGLSFGAMLASFRREPDAVRRIAESAIALSTEHGFPYWKGWATTFLGRSLAARGQPQEGFTLLMQGLAALRATGAVARTPTLLMLLAEVHGMLGQLGEGLNCLAEDAQIINAT